MAEKKQIAVIVEGGKREVQYWDSLSAFFFPKTAFDILPLSVNGNLFMLYAELNKDLDLDVIEVVRERSQLAKDLLDGKTRDDFEEVYLLMDFDPQAYEYKNNPSVIRDKPLCDIVEEMLQFFSNETEFGKLYISYPMCEALRDAKEGECGAHYRCTVPVQDIRNHKYKNETGTSAYSDHTKFLAKTWKMLVAIFLHRCGCLFQDGIEPEKLLSWYKQTVIGGTEERGVSPLDVFRKERMRFEMQNEVFVLSAFPEFLLDYFKQEFWKDLTPEIIRKSPCT